MNELTNHLENFRPEIFSSYLGITQETAIRAAISLFNDAGSAVSVQADYNLDLFQFKAIFENNTALAEISRFRISGTSADIFYRALCMFKGSESEIREAVNICLDISNKVYAPRIPYEILIRSIRDGIFKESFEITQNQEVLKVICNSYLEDILRNNTAEILITEASNLFEMLSFSYKGEENLFPFIFSEYIYSNYIHDFIQNSGMTLVLSKFYYSVSILVPILKRHNNDFLVDYLTKGSSISGITDLTLAFENKDEVFEIIDSIEENKIDYYKGNFSIPKGSQLTDEDLQIYGELLNPSEVIDNITKEQALKFGEIFKPKDIIKHPDFILSDLNLLNVDLSLINMLLMENNYLQEELISISDLITIRQLKLAHCLITPELFKAVNDSNYELGFIYESQEPLDIFIGNSIGRKKFNSAFINEIKKVYKCSQADIFKYILTYKEYRKNMDEKTQRMIQAFEKIFKD